MKPQDFMEALGGVSQEKLDALAKWQEAKTPATGEASVREKSITQTATEPVPVQRRRETVKQKKKAPAVQLLPWTAGIGAVIAACAVIAVSIGKEAVGKSDLIQTGSNAGTSVTEQTAEAVRHEPVELVERLRVTGGSDYVMMKVPPEGTVQVLRSAADAEACCQYTDEKAVKGADFDFRTFLTEDVFAAYDVLYFAFKDNQQPLYLYTCDLAGGSIAADGTTLNLSFHALIYDPAHLPKHVLRSYDDYEPDWNTYCFYTVPKDSLPDLNAITVHFEEYQIGEIPDEILAHANDPADTEGNGDTTKHTKLHDYLETTQEYTDYVNSVPKQLFLTWENCVPEDCTEAQEISAEAEQVPQYVRLMQEYYTQKTGIPCDYDFSGMGRDLDEIIENPAARIHIKGMVGCDWTMFVFFDTEPLNLSAEDERYFSESSFMNLSNYMYPALGIEDADGNTDPHFQQICRTMPAQQSLDDGVFHCYCLISSHSDAALTGGTLELGIGKMNDPRDPVQYDLRIPLDCLQTIPLQESELAATVSTFIPDDTLYNYPPNTPMTRSAVTPFGVYCVSDRYETMQKTGGWQSCYWLEMTECKLKADPAITQNNADGISIGTFGLDGQTSWGSSMTAGTGISFTDFLFDRPYDAAKGTLTVLQTD